MLFAWLWAREGLGPLRKLSARQWLALAAAGAVGVFGYAVFFMLGLTHVAAGRAALVVAVNPVLTTLIAAWWFGERMNWKIAVGMTLTTLGAVEVITQGEPGTLFAAGIGLSELLLLGCAGTWVIYTLISRRLLTGIDPVATSAITAGFGLLLLLASALPIEGPDALLTPLRASTQVWSALAFLALGATVLAYAWYFEGVAALGAGAAASYLSLVPVFGVLFAAVGLGEAVDGSILLGGALTSGGMAVMNLARR